MMRRLHINIPGHDYDVCVGSGIMDDSGTLIKEIYSGVDIAVVTDENVNALYGERFAAALRRAGFKPYIISVPPGEQSKSTDCLNGLYERLLDTGITPRGLIAALGGGVVGDLTGYAAATLLRGIRFVQIPTTLLAQVDSSVGGKVAVNLPRGKNLVGAFYQPRLVIADTDCLKTLVPRVFADGMAEVVKYGAIYDAGLFERLEAAYSGDGDGSGAPTRLWDMLSEIVYSCCDIKRRYVEEDERDTGVRMILNFGHTFGHAIEKHYDFSAYTHGEAVAVGMVMACALGEERGVTKTGTGERVARLLKLVGLPTDAGVERRTLAAGVGFDKKRDADGINFIFLREIGCGVINKVKEVN